MPQKLMPQAFCLAKWLAITGGMVLIASALLTGYDIFAFALYRHSALEIPPVIGLEEITSLILGPVIMSFMPYCELTGGHISLQIIRRPPSKLLLITTTSCCCLILLGLSTYSWLGVFDTYHDQLFSAVLDLPLWPFQALASVSLTLWFFCVLLKLLEK